MNDTEIFEKVRSILHQNLVMGSSHNISTDFTFIQPSPNHYKFQYFWDCCFHVFILCSINETDLAKKCLRSLFAMQMDNGFVGHIHYWNNVLPARATDIFQNSPSIGFNLFKSHMSSLIQPPFVAMALQRIWKSSKDERYLREMLPKLKKYFDWLAKNRDFDGDGLLSIITSFESGMDWKPSYDEVIGFKDGKASRKLFWKMINVDFHNFIRNYNNEKLRKHNKFRVKDAGFNTVYYLGLKAMGQMCLDVQDTQNAKKYDDRSKQVELSMLKLMYDTDDLAFYDVKGPDNRKLKVLTPTIFFPLAIDSIAKEYLESIMNRHYFNKDEFCTEFPVPSVNIKNPAFDPDKSLYLWRGPTWIFDNWFLHQFILRNHYPEQAACLVEIVKELISKSGFREYYNPFTGEGHGVKNFTWAGLIVDMMNNEG